MSEVYEKVKISELPEVLSYLGLWTIGTDDQLHSVKVPISILGRIGSPDTLTTTDKSSLVAAINEMAQKVTQYTDSIGNIESLTTQEKSSIVAAVNEVAAGLRTAASTIQTLGGNVGNLADLTTEQKSTLVAAINEVAAKANTATTNLSNLTNRVTTLENKIVFLTEAQFAALETPDPTKIYMTYEDEEQ